MERFVGIDLGYGFVKVTDEKEGYVFPSVVGEGEPYPMLRTSLKPPAVTDDLRLQVDGSVYYVGSMAIRQSRMPYRGLSATRAEGRDLKVLFLAALSLYAQQPNTGFAVVTGLPPGRMHLEQEILRQVQGEHRIVRYRGQSSEELVLRVEKIAVVPQPLGTYWSEVLEVSGQLKESDLLEGRTAVVDIGFRTSDLVAIEDGEYIPEQSRTIPIGLATTYEDIAEYLLREHAVERETYALDDAVIRGEIRVAGTRIDITGMRERFFAQLATKLLVELQSAWQVTEFDRVLLTGGGGQALSQYLLPHLKHGVLLSDPVTANCRGYLAWANRLWQPAQSAWGERRSVTTP